MKKILMALVSSSIIAISTHAQCTAPPSGLAAWWRAEGNALDSVGTNNGSPIGGIVYSNGKAGQAFVLNHSTSYITVPASPSLNIGTGTGITIECWTKPDAYAVTVSGGPIIEWDSATTDGLQLWNGQALFANVKDTAGTTHTLSVPTSLETNQFYHIALTYDKSSGLATLYINGTNVASANFGNITPQTTYPLNIGRRTGQPVGLNDTYGGAIDELSLYNRALSSNEIAAIYNAGTAGKCYSPVPLTISTVSPLKAKVGDSIIITGTGFSGTTSNNVVYFGGERATVTAANATSLTVTVPSGAAYAPVTVTVYTQTAYANTSFLPTYNGSGTITAGLLAPRFTLSSGSGSGNPSSTAIGDLNGDGKPDLIEVNANDRRVWIYQNHSTNGTLVAASFTSAVILSNSVGANAVAVTLADVDGDGRQDILVSDAQNNLVSIFQNLITRGSAIQAGSFGSRVDLPAGAGSQCSAVRDLDGDGLPDIVTANYTGNTISIFKAIASGGIISPAMFSARVDIAAGPGPGWVALGDIDGDGKPDVVVNNQGDSSFSVFRNLSTQGVLQTNSFAAKVDFALPGSCEMVAIADIDGDGKQDVLATGYLPQTLSICRNTATSGIITAASFASRVDFPTGGRTHRVAVGDMDGDGKADLVVTTELPDQLLVFKNVSTSGLITTGSLNAAVMFGAGWNPNAVSVADLDGDGLPDVLGAAAYEQTISIYRNASSSGLRPTITSQPASRTNLVGDAVSFTVAATGTAPLTYQWNFKGTNISKATNATLTLNNVQLTNAGNYQVTISNPVGSTNSASASLTVIPPVCTAPPSGLVSWWQGEGNALDSAGTNNGVQVGNVAYVAGKVGQAFSFNGTSSFVSVPDSAALDAITNRITIELWLKSNSTNVNSDWKSIIAKGGNAWRLQVTPGAKTLYLALGGTSAPELTGTRNVNDGQWHHVTAVYDGTRASLYVDGTLDVSTPTTGVLAQDHGPLCIGANPGAFVTSCSCITTGYFFNGMIDEPSVYNRALSSNEISALYGARGVGKCPLPPTIVTQPKNQNVIVGDSVSFGVAAAGVGPFNYQWLFKGNSIAGATNQTLTLSEVELAQAGNYSVVVGNLAGLTPSVDALLTVTTPVCTAAPSGLVAWWQGEGNALDSVGTNSGSPIGGIVYSNGKAGQAFVLNHSTSYITVPASPSLNIGTGSGITIECWTKPDAYSVTVSGGPIIEWDSVNTDGLQLWNGQALFANVKDTSGNTHTLQALTSLETNQFYHIALTYDKSSGLATLYLNGTNVASANFGNITPQTTYPLNIGRRTGQPVGLNDTYGGAIDELSLYKRALTPNEIAAIYGARGAGKCPLPPTVLSVAPANYYVNEGATVAYTVTAVGSPTLTYQWQHEGSDITDATNATLTLSNVVYAQAGNYDVVVSNPAGMTTSSNVVLQVNRAPIADASATEPLTISPDGTSATVVLDGSHSSDPDGNALTYAWFHTGDTNPFATGVVSIQTLPVGTNQLTLTVNDGMASDSQAFSLEVITTSQAVDRLITLVKSGSGNTQPLIASLRAALAAIDRGQPNTAINQLEAFINKVQAQLAPDDPALAAQLIADAQAIIDALNGGSATLQVPLQITSLNHGHNGKQHLNIKGANGRVYVVETSTNMVDWVPVGVASKTADGSYEFDDSQTQDSGMRFYRIVSPK